MSKHLYDFLYLNICVSYLTYDVFDIEFLGQFFISLNQPHKNRLNDFYDAKRFQNNEVKFKNYKFENTSSCCYTLKKSRKFKFYVEVKMCVFFPNGCAKGL